MSTGATTPIDPDVKVPAAVLAAAARAEQLHRQAFTPDTGNAPSEPTEPTATTTPTEPTQTAPTTPPEPTQTAPTTTTPATPEPTPPQTDWERKYKGMEGRYKQQVANLEASVAALQNALAAVQAQTAHTSATPTAPQHEKLITPDEEKEFGNDFLGVVGRKAREEISPEVTALKNEIATLKAQLGQVSTHVVQSTRERLFTTLDHEVQDWRTLNNDQEFLDWLALPDAFSGAIRHDLMKAAFEANNAPRVAAFFKGFLAEKAALSGPAGDQPRPTPAGKTPLESLAAPGRAKSAAGNTPPAEKPYFTGAEIAAFYTDVQRGKYAGRDAEKNRLEAQIFEATREGRVRN